MSKNALSVLVVDDDPGVATTAEWSLRHFGCTVSVTLQATQALALAQKINPDVILCDAAMPEMSGVELITLLKSRPTASRIPVVLMTGHSESKRFADVPWNAF